VYTIVERRTINRERLQETVQRAQREFFPQLQRAPGFVGFYLVTDEERSINTAIVVWEDQAQAEAFEAAGYTGWLQTLEAMGHTLQSDNRGQTVIQLQPQQ
jgi:heme-degrading monooxygenase HmoA